MHCDYCNRDFSEKDIGRFKDKCVCFQCATDQGIPADFEFFLEDTPLAKDGDDPLLTGSKPRKEKDKGNLTVTFLVSAICAVGAVWATMAFPQFNSYVYLAEGVTCGLFARLLQKGRGGNHQNVAAIMIMLSFFLPNMKLIASGTEFDPMALARQFIFLISGVFASYMLLVEITPAKKKEDRR